MFSGQDGKETLLEALHREIREELGLDVSRSECTPFFAWESCYPTLIEHGIVRKQHFVLYYLIKIDNNFLSEQKVVPQKVEVNSVAWITRDHVKKALSSDLEHHDEFKGIQLKDDVYQETTFTISKELQSLNHSYIDYMVDRPRLTTGTYYLLKHWMNK
jgi:8-oxo-dGTP pyrophosphatase MutT (NUDIX family)